MKVYFLIMLSVLIMTSAWAGEVDTDCPAMNENREKIIKPVKDQIKTSTKSVQQ